MSTTAEAPRSDLIDRWAIRSALSTVLHNVGMVCNIETKPNETVEDISPEIESALFSNLWPGDAEPDNVTHARSCALAASILAQLATDEARDYLLRESARLSALAAENLKGVADDA